MITEQQYQRLMKEYQKSGRVKTAAMKAGMDRKTARDYLRDKRGPKQRRKARPARTWRTRPDPLKPLWPLAEPFLAVTPELEAKALFEHLLARLPEAERAEASCALRTFQRRVEEWRRHHGPPKEVFFPQATRPGEWMQVDWTHADELGVTIQGVRFDHLLCHAVLCYSNVQHATPCRSESMLSLKAGLPAALLVFGGAPDGLRTDQSSTATHQLKRGEAARGFNQEYLSLCEHYGLKPATINRACPQENGDIESANGHLKRRLKNHLALRCSSDFASEAAYAAFVAEVCHGANALRHARFVEERAVLRTLPPTPYPQGEEIAVRVCGFSTIRVKSRAYSVPARLIGAMVKVEVSEAEIVVRHGREEVLRCPRLTHDGARIDYRHVIDSLRRKPGAFANYLYREELFPRAVFRQAYDALARDDASRASRDYVDLLGLAAAQGEDEVAAALGAALRHGELPRPIPIAEAVARARGEPPAPPELPALAPELAAYDRLLEAEAAA
jgi:transposase